MSEGVAVAVKPGGLTLRASDGSLVRQLLNATPGPDVTESAIGSPGLPITEPNGAA